MVELPGPDPGVVADNARAANPREMCGPAQVDPVVVIDPRRQEHPLQRRSGAVGDPSVFRHRKMDLGAFRQCRCASGRNVDAAAPALEILGTKPADADASFPGVSIGEGPIPKVFWKLSACAHPASLLDIPSGPTRLSTATRRT
ncbi:hypothetical protein SAT01_14420 [Sinomonas atrocyanea]|nr:hypothetical protein SAT01_14420 [Sinomonas atrocyanea]GGG79545.1 hypothetical protein GCM10007172_35880 [Sinomonas atrocyanea]